MGRSFMKIRCPSLHTKSGYILVDASDVAELAGSQAAGWIQELERAAGRYRSPTQISGIVLVCRFWLSRAKADPALYPLPPLAPQAAISLLTCLRRAWYETSGSRGTLFSTTSIRWDGFLRYMRQLRSANLFTAIDLRNPCFAAFPISSNLKFRSRHGTALELSPAHAPKSFRLAQDSYNTHLITPISIVQNSAEYLDQYLRDLEGDLRIFRTSALLEFRHLRKRLHLGTRYKALASGKAPTGTSPSALISKLGRCRACRLIVAFLFALDAEGQGLTAATINNDLSRRHQTFVSSFGRWRLLPYLGILTPRAAAPLITLLLIELPRWNVDSIVNARLQRVSGGNRIVSIAGDSYDVLRGVVCKPRAGCEKSEMLTPLAAQILRFVLDTTHTARQWLQASGQEDEASFLWVGALGRSRRGIGRFTYSLLRDTFHTRTSNFEWWRRRREGSSGGRNRHVPQQSDFIRSHNTLRRWTDQVTLRMLRVSSGVAKWLRSGGDIAVAASVFGHRDPRTTIQNYIPMALQNALYERQIRRWQNLLISAACHGKPYLLDALDFCTRADLHLFLCGLLREYETTSKERIPELLQRAVGYQTEARQVTNINRSQLVLVDDHETLSVAFLYREQLLAQSTPPSTDRDSLTGTSAQMWLDLTNALFHLKSDDGSGLARLVSLAKQKCDSLRSRVHLPLFPE